MRRSHRVLLSVFLAATVVVCSSRLSAQQMPADYEAVLKQVGRSGDFKDGVLKVGIPRNDLHVTVAGRALPTPFGFGGWFALSKGHGGEEVLMGDFVLLQEEVNPVMSALLEQGLEVTALHNHFLWEQPRVMYMHIHGHGKAMDLATRIKPALDLIGHVVPQEAPPVAPAAAAVAKNETLDTARIAAIVGRQGEQNGSVYKIAIGRSDLAVEEMGATINARMGLNTWAAFTGNNQDAVVAGDVAMLEAEVPLVLATLRKNGLDVVSIHHHMLGTKPVVIFLHYWGTGPAEKLANGFRAALDATGIK